MFVDDLFTFATFGLIVVAAWYVVFQALRLRRVLVDQPYRARALWTGIGGLSVLSLVIAEYVDTVYGNTPTTLEGLLVEDLFWGLFFLGMGGWVASNINVAIAADYLNRDTLSWKKGGGVIFVVVIIITYLLASLPSSWVPQLSGSIGFELITILFFISPIYATVALAVSYRRILDRQIRTYTKWVVLSFSGLILTILVETSPIAGATILAVALWAYSMFRSVGSLAIRTKSLPS
jgi:hypothetical protein